MTEASMQEIAAMFKECTGRLIDVQNQLELMQVELMMIRKRLRNKEN